MAGPYSGISVSQLLAQREKLAMAQQQQANQNHHSTQMWSQSVQMHQSNNRVSNFVDPTNGQIIRYQNPNQVPNRMMTNSPMLVGNTMMVQQNQQQPHQTFQANQTAQILQQQSMHGNQQQSQMLMQNNGNQQILTHNQQPQIHHNILGPNGQVISVQSQQNPHNQIMQNSMQQQGIVIHSPQTIQQPQQQRVVLNEDMHQNHSIQQPTNITINMSGQNLQQDEIFQRLQAQQFNQSLSRSESDQIKILQQQIDNKNNRQFISNNSSNQTFNNNSNMISHQLNNSVLITQHKTPPWQQNKITAHSQSNQMNGQNIVITSQNSGSVGNIYERVPPLHHHTPPPPVWNEDVKKKTKMCKTVKKQRPYNLMEHRGVPNESQMACPNIDVRQIPMEHRSMQPSSSPSFMEDPSGYLAQQTALLNSTISRQTGINNGSGFICHSPGTPPQQHVGMQGNPIQSSTPPTGIPLPSNVMHNQSKPMQCYPSSRPPSNKPISKSNEVTSNQNDAQCQGCVTTSQIDNCASPYSKSLINNRQFSRPNSQPGTPSREDSPVTSSTYSDRFVNVGHQQSPDLRPIQGGTISTSNGSPMEVYNPQSESSPSASSSRSANTPNTFVSSSSTQFVVPSHNSPNVYSSTTSISRENSHTPSPNVEPNQNFSNVHQNVTNQGKIEGYCPHPHAAGVPLDLPVTMQPRTVTTMASGRTFGSNTITSVLAGRAQTATVSINTPALGATLSLPHSNNNQQNQSQNQIMQLQTSKSPLEMVQSVVSNIQVPSQQINTISIANNQQISPSIVKQSPQGTHIPPGHILVSSGGQIIMTNNGQGTIMPPPPPKIVPNSGSMPPISVSPLVTNVTAAVTQVIPNVGVAQQVLGQQTVLVNALPTPFVIQPGVMTVDGMTMSQNMQIPQIVTGNVIQQQIQIDSNSDQARNQTQFINRQPTLISPDSGKRKGKKRKLGSQTVASMLQVAAQQNAGVVIPQQSGFQTQSFQMTHSPQGVNSGSVLQSLTIVPGKGGGPPQIVMNGQPSSTTFSPQQLITGSQSTQQINLLQPVNLLNGTTGMVQNFPTIQQFIVPGLGGMVMTTDGSGNATLLPDSSVGMQLQLQNVNGQNVLTPVQNTGNTVFGTNGSQSILTAGPAGMVIRSPGTTQGKIIQQQHSPGAQFLSPNGGQFVVNGAQFNGQLSPLVASVSPSQQVTVRPASSVQHTQHEFIQCGQMGQTLMVPCQNNAPTIASTATSQQNTTFVQQNTTIVQQQTTMLSNNQQTIQNFQANNSMNHGSGPSQNMGGTTTLNVDQNFVINSQMNDQQKQQNQNNAMAMAQQNMNAALLMQRHSVSTQTAVGQGPSVGTTVSAGAGSPPDTTTHSPLAPGADTTTHGDASPSPPTISRDHRQITHAMAMVHCISSSEPDVTDIQSVSGSHDPGDWSRSSSTGSATPKSADCTDFMIMTSNTHLLQNQVRKSVTPTYVESTMSAMNDLMKPQEAIISSQKIIKRKHSDALAVLETRHLHTSLQDDDTDESRSSGPNSPVNLNRGELVWGAAHGCPAWPGKLVDGPDLGDGRVWVRWFGGDKVAAAVDPATLQTLTQGLDAHHRARKKCRKSRKLNSQLENAIQEAMIELDMMSEKGQPSSSVCDKKDIAEADMKPTSSSVENSKREVTGRLRSSQSRRLNKNQTLKL